MVWLNRKLVCEAWQNINRYQSIALTIYLLPLQAAANKPLLGVYYGNNSWQMSQLQAMEKWQGKQHTTIALFTNWCNSTAALDNLFGQQLVKIWDDRHVPAIAWFNQDKETDWAVFGGDRGDSTFVDNGKTYKTYSAYKTVIRDRNWISTNAKNPRLITDAEFAGWSFIAIRDDHRHNHPHTSNNTNVSLKLHQKLSFYQ